MISLTEHQLLHFLLSSLLSLFPVLLTYLPTLHIKIGWRNPNLSRKHYQVFRQTSMLKTQTYTLGIEQIFPRSCQVSEDISIPLLICLMNFHKPGLSSSSSSKLKQHSSLKNPHNSQPISAGLPWCSTSLPLAQSLRNLHQHCIAALKHLKFWIIITAERLQAVFITWILVKPTYVWFYCNKAHVLSTDITKSKYTAAHEIQPWAQNWARATGCVWEQLLISQVISKYCRRGQLQLTGILRFCIILEAQCDTLLKIIF